MVNDKVTSNVMIKLQELQEQVLELPIKERWTLVQTLLASIQQETLSSIPPQPTLSELDPWTQSLIGVIRLDSENPEESYVNYLEEKYS
ncbi:MAG: hypothetical protein HEQ13_23855 [Dolichospermum sp. DEX189]|uniref:Uncharacterized protein n=1 Tax=Aphanizomenon flos-aquae FACHB-1040 TaxID=2692887 RepID=A0ABR8BQ51_APHFL|nr:hypothetical protein [Aphanizomenon flos-aquae]MBD2277044.1 hypothetical protein [Aphanizomenon flos-aquae FACHB-1040]MBO1072202.1 hypothetical protein [Dolichospermum sp. DEX189]